MPNQTMPNQTLPNKFKISQVAEWLCNNGNRVLGWEEIVRFELSAKIRLKFCNENTILLYKRSA